MLSELERFESELRRHYYQYGHPLLLETTHAIGRRQGLGGVKTVSFLKKLDSYHAVHFISGLVIPNLTKTIKAGDDQVRFCIVELKKQGKETPTPNEILSEFLIFFGKPDNVESFMRSIRQNRDELMKAEPFVQKKENNVQKTLMM